jgi:hypothetical protein
MTDEETGRPFIVRSVRGSQRLELSQLTYGSGAHGHGAFIASLRGDPVTAVVHVEDRDLPRWAELFGGMAASWRGWRGTKDVESLEGHLTLRCSTDACGHVSIRVRFRGDFGVSDWVVEQTLLLEAGQLDDLAIQADRFFGPRR